MTDSANMNKIEKLLQRQTEAFNHYTETKNKKHLKTVYRCIAERDKILVSKIKEIKSKM